MPNTKSNHLKSSFYFPDNVERLKNTYEHVDDIDLFVGGFLEEPDTGAILAQVFRCIVGDTFQKLKFGDRYTLV